MNILVLCTGNSCRSVLSEATFNHLGPGRTESDQRRQPTRRHHPESVLGADGLKEFDDAGRMRQSGYYDRVVDVMEELFKMTLLLRGRTAYLTDRYSERNERALKAIDRHIQRI